MPERPADLPCDKPGNSWTTWVLAFWVSCITTSIRVRAQSIRTIMGITSITTGTRTAHRTEQARVREEGASGPSPPHSGPLRTKRVDILMGTEVAPGRETWAPDLTRAIVNHTATVGVVGLGNVGLPLIAAAAGEGFPVVGVDLDAPRVLALSEGRSYVVDVSDQEDAALRDTPFTTDVLSLRDADVILIAVPTPLTDASPDLSMVKQAGADVAHALRP